MRSKHQWAGWSVGMVMVVVKGEGREEGGVTSTVHVTMVSRCSR